MPEPAQLPESRVLRAKRRGIVIVLCVLALWPAGHRLLAARYDVNPWKFFGWAMYCRPPGKITMEIRAPGGPASGLLLVPPDWEHLSGRFLRWRKHAGSLARPDRLGRILLEENPGLQEIEIDVRHTRLRSKSARVASQAFEYRYRR